MIEIRFDPASADDRAVVQRLLASYNGATDDRQPTDYTRFVQRRMHKTAAPHVLDFLHSAGLCDDLEIKVQAASARIAVRRYRSNVAVVHTSGRVLIRAPEGLRVDLGELFQETAASEQGIGYTAQIYLDSDEATKAVWELIELIRDTREER